MKLLILTLTATLAAAHEGEPFAPHDVLRAWSWDPLIIAGLLITAWLYWRGATDEHGIFKWERRCYWAGWWSLVVALVSPVHPMGEALFSAHMVQHELLMLISAPLLVLGRPFIPYLWGLPISWRRSIGAATRSTPLQAFWRWITLPLHSWFIHAAALWVWHAPSLFQATVRSDFVHGLQHLSFLLSALLFWWALLRGREAGQGYGMAVLYVFSTGVHSSILGALLTFSPRVWYRVYLETTSAWGLTPLEDQQLGGLIMWVPAGLVFAAAGLAMFARWMREPVHRAATTILLVAILSASCMPHISGREPQRGKAAIDRYGCGSCHTIPGVRGANSLVGPPLTKMALRTYVGGVLTNTPENLTRWIKDPPAVDPLTAMPKLGVTDEDLRDIVDYLYTLR